MHIFISGGCKNGKSSWAETLAVAQCPSNRPLYYIATMRPADEEDQARIARHRASRADKGFSTLEWPWADAEQFGSCEPDAAYLVDSVTALLSNEMFRPGQAQPSADAVPRVVAALQALLNRCPHVVLVSDFIYSDAQLYDSFTQSYRRSLARVDQALAAQCEAVLEVCQGIPTAHKGEQALRQSFACLAQSLPDFSCQAR